MSDDIVARLRNKRAWDLDNLDEMDGAADEIERLRAELALKEAVGNELKHAVANCTNANSYIDELEAERDALRGLLREAVFWVPIYSDIKRRIDAALKGDGDGSETENI